MVSDVLPSFAVIRPLTKHSFEADDADGEVVDGDAVVLAAHDLGRHVAGRAAGVLCVLRIPDARDAEVREPEVAVAVEDEVLGLDVAVDDALVVHVLQAEQQAGQEEPRLLFGKLPVLRDVVPEVAPVEQVHDEVEVLAVLEGVVHVHEERVLQRRQQLALVHHAAHGPLRDNSALEHLLHGEHLVGLISSRPSTLCRSRLCRSRSGTGSGSWSPPRCCPSRTLS